MRNTGSKNSLLTRRNWAAIVAAVPLAAQVASTPQTAPTATTSASSPADDVRKVSEQLAQVEIPMTVEPAFTFHA